MRDAATIQAHLRQYDALVDSRLTLLKLRPNVRQSWVALAVAYHLNGDLVEAEKIVSHYEETLRVGPIRTPPAPCLIVGFLRKSPTTTSSTLKYCSTTYAYWKISDDMPTHSRFWTLVQSREQLSTEPRSWN